MSKRRTIVCAVLRNLAWAISSDFPKKPETHADWFPSAEKLSWAYNLHFANVFQGDPTHKYCHAASKL
jgi:hypothetical protein